jgi:hypothetical protein
MILVAFHHLHEPHPPAQADWNWWGPEGCTMDTKKIVAGAALAGTLVVGTAGVAVAADTSSPPASDPSGQSVRHPRLLRAARAAGKVVLGVTGGTPQELRAFLKGGGTVAQWATNHGSTPQAVSDALVQAADARVDQALANGKIDQARADKIKARIPTIVEKLMTRTWGQHAQT